MATQPSKIQMRRGLSPAWESANPTLAYGEPGFETNSGASRFKIGNGIEQWSELPHISVHGRSVAVGLNAGQTTQGVQSIAIGYNSGQTSQGNQALSIGWEAGMIGQKAQTVAIGGQAGATNQGFASIGIGYGPAQVDQGERSIAIGSGAGANTQGAGSIAIGWGAGDFEQGDNAIAIGKGAGQISQGSNSIAIGHNAGFGVGNQDQQPSTIILNATGGVLNAPQFGLGGFFVAPIRNLAGVTTGFFPLLYNPDTKEIAYSAP